VCRFLSAINASSFPNFLNIPGNERNAVEGKGKKGKKKIEGEGMEIQRQPIPYHILSIPHPNTTEKWKLRKEKKKTPGEGGKRGTISRFKTNELS